MNSLSIILALIAGTLIVGIPYSSLFEWTLHKHLMHRPHSWFMYPFRTHTMTHHRIYRADQSYHDDGSGNEDKITMAWWNGPVIVVVGSLPYYLVAFPLFFFVWWVYPMVIIVTGIAISGSYYRAYEYLHLCMHKPRVPRLERSLIFQWFNRRHILHHRWQDYNFNVLLPIADFLFGTLLLRSKIPFKQVRGPFIPDVQPLSA
jgi:hypothetical protein